LDKTNDLRYLPLTYPLADKVLRTLGPLQAPDLGPTDAGLHLSKVSRWDRKMPWCRTEDKMTAIPSCHRAICSSE
jgi:hypothetical protein